MRIVAKVVSIDKTYVHLFAPNVGEVAVLKNRWINNILPVTDDLCIVSTDQNSLDSVYSLAWIAENDDLVWAKVVYDLATSGALFTYYFVVDSNKWNHLIEIKDYPVKYGGTNKLITRLLVNSEVELNLRQRCLLLTLAPSVQIWPREYWNERWFQEKPWIEIGYPTNYLRGISVELIIEALHILVKKALQIGFDTIGAKAEWYLELKKKVLAVLRLAQEDDDQTFRFKTQIAMLYFFLLPKKEDKAITVFEFLNELEVSDKLKKAFKEEVFSLLESSIVHPNDFYISFFEAIEFGLEDINDRSNVVFAEFIWDIFVRGFDMTALKSITLIDIYHLFRRTLDKKRHKDYAKKVLVDVFQNYSFWLIKPVIRNLASNMCKDLRNDEQLLEKLKKIKKRIEDFNKESGSFTLIDNEMRILERIDELAEKLSS